MSHPYLYAYSKTKCKFKDTSYNRIKMYLNLTDNR